LFIGALLLSANNLLYATNWNLTVIFFYFSLHFVVSADVLAEAGITQIAFTIVWTIAIGISIVTASDSTVMDQACAQYGCATAWVGNVIIHYVPPLLVTYHILGYQRSIHQLLQCRHVAFAFLAVATLGIEYCTFMNPKERYHFGMCTQTFLAWILASAASALLALACSVVALADSRTIDQSTGAVAPNRATASKAAASTLAPFDYRDASAQPSPWLRPSYQWPAALYDYLVLTQKQSHPVSQPMQDLSL
jgi:hypothetical protein